MNAVNGRKTMFNMRNLCIPLIKKNYAKVIVTKTTKYLHKRDRSNKVSIVGNKMIVRKNAYNVQCN